MDAPAVRAGGGNVKSLLMCSEMVKAYSENRKTQTRRIVEPQPVLEGVECYGDSWSWKKGQSGFSGVTTEQLCGKAGLCWHAKLSPGEQFYIKETWAPLVRIDGDFPADRFYTDVRTIHTKTTAEYVIYRADGEAEFSDEDGGLLTRKDGASGSLWKSPLFMPEWAARFKPTCVSVRCERLQDITEADAKAEGCQPFPNACKAKWSERDALRCAYMVLWESINGPGSWAANPWVWVYEFTPQFTRIKVVGQKG
jgi:hypothetical protein